MDILYTINNNYIDIMLTSLYSLICNSNLPYINLHVVTLNFSKNDYYKLEKFVNNFENIKLYTYKLETFDIEKYNIPNWRGSQIANARLFYPRIIKENNFECCNLLYLDSDTIIVSDISKIKQHSNHMISACIDESSKKSYYMNKLKLNRYYNSGVLYINMDKFLSFNIENEIKNYLSKYNLVLTYPDQDLLNIIINKDINCLEPRYNMSANSYLLDGFYLKLFYNTNKRQISYKQILEEQEKKVVLHSYGAFNIKPWTNNNINPFNDIFMSYMNYINNNYTKEDLNRLKKLLSKSPFIFKNLSIIKTYLPDNLDELARTTSLILQKALDK